jgi:hypothetical protein
MKETAGPESTYGKELLLGWWRPIGLMVVYMSFTDSVRIIFDTTTYTVWLCAWILFSITCLFITASVRYIALYLLLK